MTAPDYPRCEVCGQHPRVIRHIGGTTSVVHMGDARCEIVLAAYPEAKAQAMWRLHAVE